MLFYHFIADIKKRKVLECASEINNIPSNGMPSSVEEVPDHQYAVPTIAKNANCTPSQDQPLTANNDSVEKVVTATKKNIARKHTGPTNISKTIKDVENTVLTELSKQHEQNLLNGFIHKGNTLQKKERRDQSTNTESQYKVNLSIDSLSSNTLKNIFKSMRKTLTRRVSPTLNFVLIFGNYS